MPKAKGKDKDKDDGKTSAVPIVVALIAAAATLTAALINKDKLPGCGGGGGKPPACALGNVPKPLGDYQVDLEYCKSVPDGPCLTEGPAGRVSGACRVGLMYGDWLSTDERSDLVWSGRFSAMGRNGHWKIHDSNGLTEGDYRDSQRVGTWRIWTASDGEVRRLEGEYLDGEQQGAWRLFTLGGELLVTDLFARGKLTGQTLHCKENVRLETSFAGTTGGTNQKPLTMSVYQDEKELWKLGAPRDAHVDHLVATLCRGHKLPQ